MHLQLNTFAENVFSFCGGIQVARLARKACHRGTGCKNGSGFRCCRPRLRIDGGTHGVLSFVRSACIYNSLTVLQPLAKRGIHVHLALGLYVPDMAAVFGQETEEYFGRHGLSIYFLSSARVDVRTGLFNLNPSTYGVKQIALANARKTVLLAHHDKFCDSSLEAFSPLSSVDAMVTDYIPEGFRDTILQTGIKVVETSPENASRAEKGNGDLS